MIYQNNLKLWKINLISENRRYNVYEKDGVLISINKFMNLNIVTINGVQKEINSNEQLNEEILKIKK